MTIIFDLETNGFLLDVTKIHCIALKIDDKPTVCYTDIEEAISILKKADRLVGHNIVKYDIPVINKLYNINLYSDSVFDTLLASKLAYPNLSELDSGKGFTGKIVGSHSLKAWGYRLGNHKIDFGKDDETAWDYVTDEMIDYCIQDVNVTASLYKRLLKRNIPDEALRLENAFANIIGRQEQYGVLFDMDKAIQLTVELKKEQDEMESNLYKIFKPMYLADGKLKTQAEYKTKFPFRNIYGSHQPVKLTTFNPGSRHHIVKWLHHLYKWKPTKLTDKGSPIVDESVLSELPYEEAKVLSRYFTVKKLLGQLSEGDNAWLNMVKKDGRIHGSVDTIGAVSRRCTHSRPNMAQVPSTRAFKGEECRALFTVPKGKKLVGCDADGLELRTLSHYMARYDNSAYAKAVDEGKKENGTDIHTVNQKAAGLATRDEAKTFILTQVIY